MHFRQEEVDEEPRKVTFNSTPKQCKQENRPWHYPTSDK